MSNSESPKYKVYQSDIDGTPNISIVNVKALDAAQFTPPADDSDFDEPLPARNESCSLDGECESCS